MGKTTAITIDKMAKTDLEQVLAIEFASFSLPWSRNLFLSEFRNSPISLMLVACAAEGQREVVGYIVCWVVADEIHILDLATRPDIRRHGIARQLVLAALRQAYEIGARQAFLEVRASNTPALKLYESLGFSQQQVRFDYYDSPPEDAIVMGLTTERYRHSQEAFRVP